MAVQSLSRSSFLTPRKYNSLLVGNEAFNPSSDFLIQEQVLTSTTASVTFDVSTLAAQGYKHLQLRITTRDNRSSFAGSQLYMRFNADTGANYSWHTLQGSGSSVSSGAGSGASLMYVCDNVGGSGTGSAWAGAIIDILDFSNTNKYKTMRALGGMAQAYNWLNLSSGSWRNTDAITSIIFSGLGSQVAGSRFSLYGSLG